jgi:hypothetical protein
LDGKPPKIREKHTSEHPLECKFSGNSAFALSKPEAVVRLTQGTGNTPGMARIRGRNSLQAKKFRILFALWCIGCLKGIGGFGQWKLPGGCSGR